MTSETRYQTMPAGSLTVATVEQPEMEAPSLRAPEMALWTGDQLNWVALQVVVIGAILIFLILFGQDSLWNQPKMLAAAGALTIFNFGLFLFLCAILNRCFPPNQEETQRSGDSLTVLLMTLHLLVFFIPVVLLLVIGPAMMQTVETLLGI
jgi:hypothetical protein